MAQSGLLSNSRSTDSVIRAGEDGEEGEAVEETCRMMKSWERSEGNHREQEGLNKLLGCNRKHEVDNKKCGLDELHLDIDDFGNFNAPRALLARN